MRRLNKCRRDGTVPTIMYSHEIIDGKVTECVTYYCPACTKMGGTSFSFDIARAIWNMQNDSMP